MMDLDDIDSFRKNDPQDMLAEINGLPGQLLEAWRLGQNLARSGSFETGLEAVIISGMGGSAIGADLLAAYLQPACRVPILVHRDYGLPAFASGSRILVIASSHSGNTEETLDSFEAARAAGCSVLAITTGGRLAKRAGDRAWIFPHAGMPRAAVGYSFGLLLALFTHLDLIPDPSGELDAAVEAMHSQLRSLRANVPVAANPAKRLAGQLVGRWVNVLASGGLAPVARRWKCQINELAKAGAGFEALPESDHNTLAGLVNPTRFMQKTFTVFLRAPSDHPRNRLRHALTHDAFLQAGLCAGFFDAQGETLLAHIWTALHFGDYVAYYLAMAYGMDPTPVQALESLKKKLRTG